MLNVFVRDTLVNETNDLICEGIATFPQHCIIIICVVMKQTT